MKRDLTKAVAEYDRKFNNPQTGKGAFYLDDMEQIRNMSKSKTGQGTSLYSAIGNALKVGFIVGYRTAQRDARKARKGDR